MDKINTNINTNIFNKSTNVGSGPFSKLEKSAPYVVSFLILILIISTYLVLFNVKKSSQEENVTVMITLLTSLLIVVGCIMFLPNLAEIKNLFVQIGNVTYVILFTIAVILFYTLVSKDILNNYSNYINPLLLVLGIFAFYKSIVTDYIGKFNVNYERIKMLIILTCLIALSITFYKVNPGNMASKYFGYSLLITAIIGIFTFLYILVLMSMPDGWKTGQTDGNTGTTSQIGNLLSKFSPLGSYGTIFFILFLTITTFIISYKKKELFENQTKLSGVVILVLLTSILWISMLSINLFSDSSILDNLSDMKSATFFKKALLVIFGLIISGLIIFWITYNVEHLSGKTGLTNLILNTLLVAIVLGLVYKTINVRLPVGNAKKNAFFTLLINILFYIPCLISGTFDSIGNTVAGEYKATETGSLIMLIVAVILLIIYFKGPNVVNSISAQGGKQLVNQPVYTDSEYNLGNYIDLNGGSDTFDYQYAISCWIYVDAAPPNTSESYNKYTSLLNFGEKPNILYNGKENTLMITMQQKDLKDVTKNKLIDFDNNGNRILYKNNKFLLQKWNNIIINYNGGTMDIFLNGELVKSLPEVVPYYTIDKLNIGENGGIKGGICNVIYFRKALNATNIYYLYDTLKDKTPPVVNPESSKTILSDSHNSTSLYQ